MNFVRGWGGLVGLVGATAIQAAALGSPGGSWLADAQRELGQREYQTSVSDRGLQAPNRAQGFRTYFDGNGIRLVARSAGSEPLAALTLAAYGRFGDIQTPALAEVRADAAEVTLSWPGISARYENSADGLLQEINLDQRPPGAGRLSVALVITAATAQVSDGVVLLHSASNTLRLGAIRAHDARGRDLAVKLAVEGSRILLTVDDRQADYPVTVKSVFTGFADALLEANQANARLGVSVAGAADVNGDGYADVIVGANLYDNGEADEGAAFLYFGGAGVFNTSADAQLESNQINAQFGRSVAGAGDVNGDGYADVTVGANLYDFGTVDEGAAFIYFGGAGAFNTTVDAIVDADQANAGMGTSVAGAGDVNGDGYADVIVGSPGYDNGHTDEGAAFVFFGGAGAFNTSLDAQIESNQANARLGGSVSGAGDINGDGFADVIVGALLYSNGEANEGAAFIYFGGAGVFNTVADAQLESNQVGAVFGVSVAGAGDVNGDGFADVIVGAYLYDNGQTDEGAAFVYFGSAGSFNTTADAQLEVNDTSANLGFSVAGGGDVNGDGYADVIVGAPSFGALDEGAAFAYFGGAGAFDANFDAQLNSFQVSPGMALSVASAGDVNGDGFADLIVGAALYDNGQMDEGAALVYFGGAGVFNTAADAQLESNQLSAGLGWSVASAGDVNGDGFADVIVGAPLYDSGEVDEGVAFVFLGGVGAFDTNADALLQSNPASGLMSFSVAGAGDVNGDGYADVIVAAPGYDNGENNEGAVFLYFGGVGAFDSNVDAVLESNQADALLGISLAAAGDVNGDGYADIIVGAPFPATLDGGARAYIYLGGAGAFDTSADAELQPSLGSTQLGGVSGAGDVNGDGYADVIVGMVDTGANPGAALIYFGGSGAFNISADAQLQPAPAGASLGSSVAGAGDINGDGFADVIVGANGYDGSQLNEGACFVYLGGAGAFNTVVDAQFESNQVDAALGSSVAGAGDVNGDGYADVIVGAPSYDIGQTDEGAAFVFYGAAGGLETVADAQLESNQIGAALGTSVAGAGDVNGDGFADVIVGARGYDSGQADEGAAFVYYGTAKGRLVLASQFRGDGSTAVEPWGLSQQADGFVVSIEATSARGRERARLQVEACPNAASFGSLLCDIRTATTWTDLGTNPLGATLVLPVAGLSVDRIYHWRARVQTTPFTVTAPGIVAPPQPAFGPWRRLQANAAVADIRISSPPPPPVMIFSDGFE